MGSVVSELMNASMWVLSFLCLNIVVWSCFVNSDLSQLHPAHDMSKPQRTITTLPKNR